MLREAIAKGEFGEGLTKGQRESDASLESFISARETPEMFAELIKPLEAIFNRGTDRAAAQTREGFSATGNRFSTGLAQTESRQRGDRQLDFQGMLSELFFGQQDQLLNAIGQQSAQGAANAQPFFDFAGLGILPENTIVSDSPSTQALKFFTELAQGFVPGGGKKKD